MIWTRSHQGFEIPLETLGLGQASPEGEILGEGTQGEQQDINVGSAAVLFGFGMVLL